MANTHTLAMAMATKSRRTDELRERSVSKKTYKPKRENETSIE